jgi:hypothetical protein
MFQCVCLYSELHKSIVQHSFLFILVHRANLKSTIKSQLLMMGPSYGLFAASLAAGSANTSLPTRQYVLGARRSLYRAIKFSMASRGDSSVAQPARSWLEPRVCQPHTIGYRRQYHYLLRWRCQRHERTHSLPLVESAPGMWWIEHRRCAAARKRLRSHSFDCS